MDLENRPCFSCKHLKDQHLKKDSGTGKCLEPNCKCWFYMQTRTSEEIEDYNIRLVRNAKLIILGFNTEEGKYYSEVENSFSMSLSDNCAFVFWTAEDPKRKILAEEWANQVLIRLNKESPALEWKIYDIHDEIHLPVVVDWDKYKWAHQMSATTMSGILDKYYGRNIPFKVKSEVQEQIVIPPKEINMSRDW